MGVTGALTAAAMAVTMQAGPTAPLRPVDGIAAIVNGEVITMGEVERALHAARPDSPADMEGGCTIPIGASASTDREVPSDSRAAMLECLIDELLVYREVRRFPQLDPAAGPVDELLDQIRGQFASDEELAAELAATGQTLAGLRAELKRQLLVEAYVENRFRATIVIAPEDARLAYESELVPDMQRRGIEAPPFEEVADDFVVPILREREVNRRVQSWIADLRRRAVITRRTP